VKIYAFIAGFSWLLALFAVLFSEVAAWILVPIPLLAFYVLYNLYKLKFWAWLVALLVHAGEILASAMTLVFDTGFDRVSVFNIFFAILLGGYLYTKRSYFEL
jgi:hypothetical protein